MKKITITTTRYKEPNWLFHETIKSLSKQKKIIAKILILDQFFNKETKEYCKKLNNKNIKLEYMVIEPKGLSYARNYAIKLCKTDFLLYIDSDAIADEYRAYNLVTTFDLYDNVGIVGGKIIPKWHKKPLILVKADYIYDIYSMLDLGDEVKEVKKIVGANFGLNKKLLGKECYFDEILGRKPGKLLGGEETDLVDRTIKKGYKVLYNGKAKVLHQVLPERISYLWVFKRIYWGGYNRGLVGGKPKANNGEGKFNIWNYVFLLFVILPYFLGYIKGRYDRKYN